MGQSVKNLCMVLQSIIFTGFVKPEYEIRKKEKTMRKINLIKGTKIITLAICMGAALALAGCGSENQENETTTAAETTTEETTTVSETTEARTEAIETTEEKSQGLPAMADLYDEIVAAAGLGSMYQVDGEDLLDSYGIDVSGCTDYVFYQADTAPSADTVALFNCKDSASAESIAEGLQIFLDNLMVTNEGYAPEEYAKASKASVETKDNFVYLIVCDKLSAAEEVVEQY